MFDYLVVGAGLAGCVFAHEASERGLKVLVIDKRNHIGGNCYVEEQNGIHVHKYGAHIFRTNMKGLFDYVSQFADFNNFINTPIARYKDEVYNLPFNMNTFTKLFGVVTPEEVKQKIDETRVVYNNPKNLEEHCLDVVGSVVYEKLIKGYTEKQWGKSCSELPVETMKRIPIRMTYNNNYYDARYQGVTNYTDMCCEMLKRCTVALGVDYLEHKQLLNHISKKIVYTGSIDELFNYKYGVLEYRSLRFEHKTYDCENKQGVAVMNYTDIETPYTRTIEHKHFMKDSSDTTIVTEEYPEQWELGKERYYPVNDEKNNNIHELYKKEAEKENILLCGRLAEYKYYDMEDTILSALCLARKERLTAIIDNI